MMRFHNIISTTLTEKLVNVDFSGRKDLDMPGLVEKRVHRV